MSYFPTDIPYMSNEELEENGIIIHKDPPRDESAHLRFQVGEILVDESKGDITAEVAIKKIRALLKAERQEENG